VQQFETSQRCRALVEFLANGKIRFPGGLADVDDAAVGA
jgi:hypothetical protein